MKKIIFSVIGCAILGFFPSVTADAQMKFDTLPNTYFYIQSVKAETTSGGYWNQPGSKSQFTAGDRIILDQNYKQNGGSQWYTFQPAGGGWYYIVCQNGGYVDVSGGANGNGVKMQVYAFNGSASQKFRFVHQGDGRFKIYTAWGRVLSTVGQNINAGTEINTWNDHASPAAEWFLYGVVDLQKYMPAGSTVTSNTAHSALKPVTQIGGEVYTLLSGEEFVFGKIGLYTDGKIKYNFSIVRKSNPVKKVFLPTSTFGRDSPLGANVVKQSLNPAPYNMYDYWIIYNGRKFGPFDYFTDIKALGDTIDNWVSNDGSAISILGVYGDTFYTPYVYNRLFRGQDAPISQISIDGNWHGYALARNSDSEGYKLYESGREILSKWRYLKVAGYLPDSNKTLYHGGSGSYNEQNLYLGNEKIAGPFNYIINTGFIPGTEEIYYLACTEKNNVKSFEVVIGSNRIAIPAGEEIENEFGINNNILSFVTARFDKKIKASKELYEARKLTVYEHNITTGKTVKHREYGFGVTWNIIDGKFIYKTMDTAQKSILIVAEGGTVLKRIPGANTSMYTGTTFAGDSSGRYYAAWFPLSSNTLPKQPLRIEGMDGIIYSGDASTVKSFGINPLNGDLQAMIELDHKSRDYLFINGKNQVKIKGDFQKFYPARTGGLMYAIQRVILPSLISYQLRCEYRLFRNNSQCGEEVWNSVDAAAMNDDGSVIALKAIITGNQREMSNDPTPESMSPDWKLVVNGVTREGRFGNPVWVPSLKKILVLQQKGSAIVLSTVE